MKIKFVTSLLHQTKSLRGDIMQYCIMLRRRRERTLHSIRNRFYWAGMTDDVARGCQTCQPCSKKKLKQGPGQGSIFALDK